MQWCRPAICRARSRTCGLFSDLCPASAETGRAGVIRAMYAAPVRTKLWRTDTGSLIKKILPPLIIALGEQTHQVPASVQVKRLGRARKLHVGLIGRAAALAIVARIATGHKILPSAIPAARPRQNMIQRQFRRRQRAGAVLAAITVPPQDTLPRNP